MPGRKQKDDSIILGSPELIAECLNGQRRIPFPMVTRVRQSDRLRESPHKTILDIWAPSWGRNGDSIDGSFVSMQSMPFWTV